MKSTGILMRPELVVATRKGIKTQTRRIAKLSDGSLVNDEDVPAHGECDGLAIPAPDYVMDFAKTFPRWKRRDCPYGSPGDELYIKEPFRVLHRNGGTKVYVRYSDALGRTVELTEEEYAKFEKWKNPFGGKSSLFMFKSMARTRLEITGIRVERIQDITEEEAKQEGVAPLGGHVPNAYRLGFMHTINTLRPGSWTRNDWFWVINYKLKQPGQ